MTVSAASKARARVRDELTSQIKEVARAQLVESGAAGLSLRAVAREMGMVSSAVYRYFPSRNELLTALIVDAYTSVADAAERADSSVRASDLLGRWLAVTRAVRAWALEHPQQYALIFGSPVPDYRAPLDTIDPAARIPLLLLAILSDGLGNEREPRDGIVRMPSALRADLKALSMLVDTPISERHLAKAVMAWTQLIGTISFELFGHLTNAIHEYEVYFDYQMRVVGRGLGLS